MGTSTTEQAAHRAVNALLDGEGGLEAFKTLRDTAKALNAHTYGWWQDVVAQRWGEFDVYDAYSFLKLNEALHKRELLAAELVLGAAPASDRLLAGNQKTLDSTLPRVFSAVVANGTGDTDGSLRWKDFIEVSSIQCVQCGDVPERKQRLKATQASLEIGSTSAAKTLLQLHSYGALARWPYDSKSLYLIVRVEPWQLGELGESPPFSGVVK